MQDGKALCGALSEKSLWLYFIKNFRGIFKIEKGYPAQI